MDKAFKRDYGSLDNIFGFLTDALAKEGANETAAFSVKLATEELFTNMVKYNTGSRADITIRIAKADGSLTVDLIDNDVDPFDPANADEAGVVDSIEDRRIGGLGLRLVRSVVDKISYEYKDRRMTVRLVKQLEQ